MAKVEEEATMGKRVKTVEMVGTVDNVVAGFKVKNDLRSYKEYYG